MALKSILSATPLGEVSCCFEAVKASANVNSALPFIVIIRLPASWQVPVHCSRNALL